MGLIGPIPAKQQEICQDRKKECSVTILFFCHQMPWFNLVPYGKMKILPEEFPSQLLNWGHKTGNEFNSLHFGISENTIIFSLHG